MSEPVIVIGMPVQIVSDEKESDGMPVQIASDVKKSDGMPVQILSDEKKSDVAYISASSGNRSSFFVRSDGCVDRIQSGKIRQRVTPPEGTSYIAATAGNWADYLLRADGVVDRFEFWSFPPKPESLKPEGFPKMTYTAVSNSGGPCYLLRSDGKADLCRRLNPVDSALNQTVQGPYQQLSGGTEVSYLLKADGSVDQIYINGTVSRTFIAPESTSYVAIASSCLSANEDIGGPRVQVHYFIRADGKVDRIHNFQAWTAPKVDLTMTPPDSMQYIDASCQEQSSFLLRSDGAIERIAGGALGDGKVTNTFHPPAGGRYIAMSAGQLANYFIRSDGQIDIITGSGTRIKLSSTISPADPVAERSGGCLIM